MKQGEQVLVLLREQVQELRQQVDELVAERLTLQERIATLQKIAEEAERLRQCIVSQDLRLKEMAKWYGRAMLNMPTKKEHAAIQQLRFLNHMTSDIKHYQDRLYYPQCGPHGRWARQSSCSLGNGMHGMHPAVFSARPDSGDSLYVDTPNGPVCRRRLPSRRETQRDVELLRQCIREY